MIFVLASETDRPVVREFFELFKTPWQHYTTDTPAKILLCVGSEVPANDAALMIIFSGDRLASDQPTAAGCESRTAPGLFHHGDVQLPVYGRQWVEKNSQQIVFRRGQTNDRPFV